MKTYAMYECSKCHKKSQVRAKIDECEASHLNITPEELNMYKELKERARLRSYIVYRTNNQENRDLEDAAIKDLLDFEKQHNIVNSFI
jgi:cytochrome c553